MEIFIDNYKGFSDTFISLKDVNFFVGDNSTGKTAILNLLELISQPNFWIAPDFNSENIEFGYFSEMVSLNSSNRKSFSIGVNKNTSRASLSEKQFIWMKFVEKELTPEVSECKFIKDNKTVWCKISDNSISYQTKDMGSNETRFSEWVRDFSNFCPSKSIEIKHTPIFGMIRSIVEEDMRGVEDHSHGRFTVSGNYEHMYWMAPVRAKAKRWYESYKLSYSPEGTHTPLLLKKFQKNNSLKTKSFRDSLIEFGKNSGLFDELNVKDDKPENPFSVYVNYGKLSLNIANVGYGVSQVLPLVSEMLSSKGNSFAIQQPEVHLHPRAQAAFGELVFKVATKNKNRVIIETHSEYLINRYRFTTNKSKSKVDAQVLFFSRDENGTHIDTIPIDQNGHYSGNIPRKFLSFFIDEELKMLEM
ncbi:MAG: AAA family ATPase [Bacteroidales bacterium]|nr:AAA family ATPase [Bacteroidales bacterium]